VHGQGGGVNARARRQYKYTIRALGRVEDYDDSADTLAERRHRCTVTPAEQVHDQGFGAGTRARQGYKYTGTTAAGSQGWCGLDAGGSRRLQGVLGQVIPVSRFRHQVRWREREQRRQKDGRVQGRVWHGVGLWAGTGRVSCVDMAGGDDSGAMGRGRRRAGGPRRLFAARSAGSTRRATS
jgi:hypothetical protein